MSYTVIYGDLYEDAVYLTAEPEGSATVTAVLQVIPQLTPTIEGTATVAVALEQLANLSATLTGTATVTSVMDTLGAKLLSATLEGSATVTANYRRTVSLQPEGLLETGPPGLDSFALYQGYVDGVSNYEGLVQAVDTVGGTMLGSMWARLFKYGTPTDNLQFKIYDAWPLVTPIATSNTVAGSGLSGEYGSDIEFTFSSPPTFTADTTYYFELVRDGARDTSNYYAWGGWFDGYPAGVDAKIRGDPDLGTGWQSLLRGFAFRMVFNYSPGGIEGVAHLVTTLTAQFLELSADVSGSATVTAALSTITLTAGVAGDAQLATGAPVGASLQVTAVELGGTYTTTGIHNLTVDLQGTSTVTASIDVIQDLTVAIEGTADFGVPGQPITFAWLAGFLFGSADLTVDPLFAPALSVAPTGTATVSAALETVVYLTAGLSGTATIGTEIETVVGLTADLQGTATVSSSIDVIHWLTAPISGTATVTTTISLIGADFLNLSAGLSGTATVGLSIDVFTVGVFTAQMTGTATVTTLLAAVLDLSAGMTGTATVTAALVSSGINQLTADITGTGTVDVSVLAQIGTNELSADLQGTATVDLDIWGPAEEQDRSLYLLGNTGVGFDDTDDDTGSTGFVSQTYPDGAIIDFDRLIYLLANIGVAFDNTDDDSGSDGFVSQSYPDGNIWEDFDRFLYLLANIIDDLRRAGFRFSQMTVSSRPRPWRPTSPKTWT